MTPAEAAALVAILAASYPSATFSVTNAAVYERKLLEFGADEARVAIDDLVDSCKFLPTPAEIRTEVMRRRAAKNTEQPTTPTLPEPRGVSFLPRPHEWAGPLARMLDEAARAKRLDAAWRARFGKPPVVDPGSEFVQLASDAAAGRDVSHKIRDAVLPPAGAAERRRS